MDTKTIKLYQPYVDLAMQLDTLRAGKFVNPAELKKSLEVPELQTIVHQQIKNWDTIFDTLVTTFANKIFWIKLVDSLRWIEIPTLTAYLFIVAIALFRNVGWAADISAPATLVVFCYLAITRVSMSVLVDGQAKKLFSKFSSNSPQYPEKLRKAVDQVILGLDSKLLEQGEGGSDFRLRLRRTDYAGVTYIVKPSRFGPEMLDAYPFPFHAKLTSAKQSVRILMARRDDKLIQALAEVPKYTEIQLAVIRPIAEQKSFPKFMDALKKMHDRFSMIVVENVGENNGVQVVLSDSIWKLDTRLSSGYLRLPYLLVSDPQEKADGEAYFMKLWSDHQTPVSA